MSCEACHCGQYSKDQERRGAYWLTAAGRAELRESFPQQDDGNAVRPLLDVLEAAEAKIAVVLRWCEEALDGYLEAKAVAYAVAYILRDVERQPAVGSDSAAAEAELGAIRQAMHAEEARALPLSTVAEGVFGAAVTAEDRIAKALEWSRENLTLNANERLHTLLRGEK